ncbi:DUF4174 domain-containing protein [Paracoccus aurantiacus]|nr:DUF4174 domain-containing protein [Paracoccus aurantiacus]
MAIAAFGALIAGGAMAADLKEWRQAKAAPVNAADTDLGDFRWEARPVIVMADRADDPDFTAQMKVFRDEAEGVADRDMLIVTDTDPGAQGDLRGQLSPDGFGVYLVGKDGGVKFSSQSPVSMARFAEIIDAMPMRQREMRDGG